MFNSKLSNALKGNQNAKKNKVLGAAAAAGAIGGALVTRKMSLAVKAANGAANVFRRTPTQKASAATKAALDKATASATKGTSKLKRHIVSQEAVEKAAANMNRVKSKAKNGGHALKSKLADVQAKARRAGRI